jgi:hypothetical protein
MYILVPVFTFGVYFYLLAIVNFIVPKRKCLRSWSPVTLHKYTVSTGRTESNRQAKQECHRLRRMSMEIPGGIMCPLLDLDLGLEI